MSKNYEKYNKVVVGLKEPSFPKQFKWFKFPMKFTLTKTQIWYRKRIPKKFKFSVIDLKGDKIKLGEVDDSMSIYEVTYLFVKKQNLESCMINRVKFIIWGNVMEHCRRLWEVRISQVNWVRVLHYDILEYKDIVGLKRTKEIVLLNIITKCDNDDYAGIAKRIEKKMKEIQELGFVDVSLSCRYDSKNAKCLLHTKSKKVKVLKEGYIKNLKKMMEIVFEWSKGKITLMSKGVEVKIGKGLNTYDMKYHNVDMEFGDSFIRKVGKNEPFGYNNNVRYINAIMH